MGRLPGLCGRIQGLVALPSFEAREQERVTGGPRGPGPVTTDSVRSIRPETTWHRRPANQILADDRAIWPLMAVLGL